MKRDEYLMKKKKTFEMVNNNPEINKNTSAPKRES
jgi:hypothetical protein